MNMKKIIAIALLIFGVLLFAVPLVLAVIATANTNVIGGADLATFIYHFCKANGGLYFLLSLAGIAFLVSGTIVNVVKK